MGSVQGPSVAIVGSGPSGCYTAQFLRKRFPDSEITIFAFDHKKTANNLESISPMYYERL